MVLWLFLGLNTSLPLCIFSRPHTVLFLSPLSQLRGNLLYWDLSRNTIPLPPPQTLIKSPSFATTSFYSFSYHIKQIIFFCGPSIRLSLKWTLRKCLSGPHHLPLLGDNTRWGMRRFSPLSSYSEGILQLLKVEKLDQKQRNSQEHLFAKQRIQNTYNLIKYSHFYLFKST